MLWGDREGSAATMLLSQCCPLFNQHSTVICWHFRNSEEPLKGQSEHCGSERLGTLRTGSERWCEHQTLILQGEFSAQIHPQERLVLGNTARWWRPLCELPLIPVGIPRHSGTSNRTSSGRGGMEQQNHSGTPAHHLFLFFRWTACHWYPLNRKRLRGGLFQSTSK